MNIGHQIRQCRKCFQIKQLNKENFPQRHNPNGTITFRHICQECYLAWHRAHHHKNKSTISLKRKKVKRGGIIVSPIINQQFFDQYNQQIYQWRAESKSMQSIAVLLGVEKDIVKQFFNIYPFAQCIICKEIKPLTKFKIHSIAKGGNIYYHKICINCPNKGQIVKCGEQRKCCKCGETKELNINNFTIKIRASINDELIFEEICKSCDKQQTKQESQETYKARKNKQNQQYRGKNKEKLKEKDRTRQQTPQYKIQRKQHNQKPEIKTRRNKKNKERRNNDPALRLRRSISSSIYLMLKSQQATKQGQSILNKLDYTLEQLIIYLESLFPMNPKITWDNYGSYWELDHIVPQSHMQYDSMDHPNFKKCWALDNLRPLDKITNSSEGNRRSMVYVDKIKTNIKNFLNKIKILD